MCLAESCEKANILIPKQQNDSYSAFPTYLEILWTSYQCYHCSKRHLKIDRINLGDFKNKSPSDAILQSSTISVKTVNNDRPWNTNSTILSTVLPCFHHYLVWDVIPLNVLLVINHKAQTEFMYQYPLVITCLQQIRLLHPEVTIKQKKIYKCSERRGTNRIFLKDALYSHGTFILIGILTKKQQTHARTEHSWSEP